MTFGTTSELRVQSASSYDDGGVSSGSPRASRLPTCDGTNARTPDFLVTGRSNTTVLESESAPVLLSESMGSGSTLDLLTFPAGLARVLDLEISVGLVVNPIAFDGVWGGNVAVALLLGVWWSAARFKIVTGC